VLLALGAQHAERLPSCTMFFKITSYKRHDFRKEKEKFVEHKMCVWIFCAIFLWNIFLSNVNSARYYHKCTNAFT